MELGRLWRLVGEFRRMPRVSIDLMCAAAAGNDPFFEKVVRQHYQCARRLHPRCPFLRRMVHGVALSRLPATFGTIVG